MASRTAGGYEPFNRSIIDRSRAKRMGGVIEMPREERPTPARKNTFEKKDPPLQSRIPSRIPQTASTRRPSLPENIHARPPLSHQNRSWGSGGSSGTARYASNFPPGSSASTSLPAKTQKNILRRKHSNISQEVNNLRTDSSDSSRSSSSTQRPQISREPSVTPSVDRTLTESPMEVRTAQTVEIATMTAQETMIYPELDRYQDHKPPHRYNSPIEVPFKISTHDLPPPTPLFSGNSSQLSGCASPSTRFSESPGPGPYSRDTTPTSICSQSPGLITTIRIPPPRMRQGSISPGHTRPPVTRRRAGSIPNEVNCISADPHGLPSVRESLASSSSNSTVRDLDRKDKARAITEKRSHLPAPPPSPPPRKSSQKFKKDAADAESPARKPRQVVTSPIKPPHPKPPVSSRTPPARPSRDGTPDLQAQQFPIPVVQSNLSSTSIHERRQSSSLMPSALPRSAMPSQHPNKPSKLAPRREPTPAPVTSAPEPRALSKPEGRAARTPSPSVSNFKTRFPLFGRRKAEPSASAQDKSPAKAPRKGPAAGTGHEGYGRIGAVRRRSSSNPANAARGMPASQESLAANSDITDPFLLERMQPIVIAGGGEVVENRNTSNEISRVESNGSSAGFTGGRSSVESVNGSSLSLASQGSKTTMWPTIFPQKQNIQGSRRPSAASTDSESYDVPPMKPTLAFRRSIQKLKSSPDAQVKIPKPIIIRPPGAVTSPSVTSMESSGGILSDDSTIPPKPEPLPASIGPRKLTKKPGRWNFFGRSQAKKVQEQPKAESTPATMPPPQAQRKAVAFYTMVDSSEQEDEGVLDVEDVLLEANVLPPNAVSSRERRQQSFSEEGRQPSASAAEQGRRPSAASTDDRRPSITNVAIAMRPALQRLQGHVRGASSGSIPRTGLLRVPNSGNNDSPPKPTAHVRASSTSVVPTSTTAMVDPFATTRSAPVVPEQKPKRSRLPQVGRIPPVVSNRPQQPPQLQSSTSPKSFSRPFQRLSTQYSTPPLQAQAHFPTFDVNYVAKGPSPPRSSTPELTREESTVTTGNSRISRDMLSHPLVGAGTEFLAFSPPRKGSAGTSSSTSSCSGNILSWANAIAVVPQPDEPLVEDEIWDEYNDLLGDVPPSASSSHGRPFYLETVGIQLESPTLHVPMVLPLRVAKDKGQKSSLRISHAPTASSVYSQDMTARIAEVMAAGETTPFSVSEFVGTYGERNHSIDISAAARANEENVDKEEVPSSSPAKQVPMPAKEKPQVPSQRSSQSSKRTNSTTSSRLTMEDQSPLAQVNLRVGSMTVSKWLTFGHVLFSPVRETLEAEDATPASPADAPGYPLSNRDSDPKRESILVVDGLGNDDWSFYAAETYPGATFFNLSPRAPLSEEQKLTNGSIPLTPANHHQIQYMDHTGRFPFAADSFTSVVYRFPVAAPKSHYRNIIAEARRVLKPGGYLELSLLDSDLNNMGIKGRRAIRALKEKTHATQPDCNLSSTADLALRLLNSRGFTDVKTCKVGVPVASSLNRRDSASNPASGIKPKKDNSKEAKERRRKERDPLEQRSLADMMNDDSPLADEGITQMVARVGRWWYTRCYEGPAGITAKDSMWRDRALLQECEEWGTSLKLTVCYARKPVGVGRVASI